MTQPILEGTPGELAPYLAEHPNRKFRLIELTEGEEENALDQPAPVLDDKAKAAIALPLCDKGRAVCVCALWSKKRPPTLFMVPTRKQTSEPLIEWLY